MSRRLGHLPAGQQLDSPAFLHDEQLPGVARRADNRNRPGELADLRQGERPPGLREPVHRPVVRGRVEAPERVFAEAGHGLDARLSLDRLPRGPGAKRVDAALVAAVQIAPRERRKCRIAYHVTADDHVGAAAKLVSGRKVVFRPAAVAREAALATVPAEVGAATRRPGQERDLLPAAGADVTDEHPAGTGVEGPSPWVAQAVHVHLAARAGSAHERVVRRNRVSGARVGRSGRQRAGEEKYNDEQTTHPAPASRLERSC